MDDLIYEELKGTGNMEIHLDRELANKRIFPAIDVEKSGTRHEELLFDKETLNRVNTLRRMLSLLHGEERLTLLIEKLMKTKNNEEFLESLSKGI
jgi:transcription termination factor Rho